MDMVDELLHFEGGDTYHVDIKTVHSQQLHQNGVLVLVTGSFSSVMTLICVTLTSLKPLSLTSRRSPMKATMSRTISLVIDQRIQATMDTTSRGQTSRCQGW